MAIEIPVPLEAYSEVNITLSGLSYNLVFKLNSRDSRLYFDLYSEDVLIKAGIKIMESQSLLGRYILEGFSHGDIFCIRKENIDENATLSNTGINKPYGLFYLTAEELE